MLLSYLYISAHVRCASSYSFAFSTGGGPFFGDLQHFGLMGVLENPVPQANNKIPEVRQIVPRREQWNIALIG